MTITLPALLALFSLLAISSGTYFLAQRTRLPYTVLLVAVGTFVLVPLSGTPPFEFLRAFTLTPELLFYVFLPVLIFESAYNINIRRLVENAYAISALAVISLLVSAGIIGGALYMALPWIGFDIPFIVCLLFGALISATDPVAVLALFKEVGAPRRLTLLFEGESIFNDGTAMALFLVILGIALNGWHGAASVTEGALTFTTMVLSGALLGLVLGGIFVRALGGARSNEYVQISLMITLAHFTFICSDYLAQHLSLFGHSVHISAIISTTVASMVIGNYGRAKILPHAQEFVEQFWTESALLANSIVFLLIGLIFATLPVRVTDFIMPTLVAVGIVATARALSIYPVVGVLNRLKLEEHIPSRWQHLLAWGSLRGALAITMVLLIPTDFAIAGWHLPYSPQEFVLSLTIGCIFATLFLKATTIKPLVRALKVDALTDLERLGHGEASALVHTRALERLTKFRDKGYIDTATAETLIGEHNARFAASCTSCKERITARGARFGERVLRMYAIGVEKKQLETLYEYGEVTESVYRKILGKLTIQYEQLERGDTVDPSRFNDRKDVFDHLAHLLAWASGQTKRETAEDRYLYYRTQTVLSRATLHELRSLGGHTSEQLFGAHVFEQLNELYASFLEGSTRKMEDAFREDPRVCGALAERLARHSILEVEARTLAELTEREMITPKVQLIIRNDIGMQADRIATMDEIAENARG